MNTQQLTLEQIEQARTLKQWRPFMRVFAAVNGLEFQTWAAATRHKCNRLLRIGWAVYEIKL